MRFCRLTTAKPQLEQPSDMKLLELIKGHADARPEALAMENSSGERMTYGQLWEWSGAVAARIARELPGSGNEPVIVYGHKQPLMVACMVACMRSGHAYVPLDAHSVPGERVAGIASQLAAQSGHAPLVLAVQPLPGCAESAARAIDAAEAAAGPAPETARGLQGMDGEDDAYIIFTSGSTGQPKGVEVTAACVDAFFPWAAQVGGAREPGMRFLDQAPFSFDLSVYELAMALSTGGALVSLCKDALDRPADMLRFLAESGADVWVSTPSFAEACLANKEFGRQLMPSLETMVFCGETLQNGTAARLMGRFPGARVVNSYGPTESTVAVASVEVTPGMAASPEPLPVGAARPGTRLRVGRADGADAPAGEWGEVVIEGDTVAKGYFGRPDLTERAFSAAQRPVEGSQGPCRAYRTGDEGMMGDDGLLRFRGRLDAQVKLNGYRIELGEVEKALLALPQVAAACVVAAERGGRASHLVAYVVSAGARGQSDFREGLALKDALKPLLPHYMVPRKVVFADALPLTANGKVDRKALAAANRA